MSESAERLKTELARLPAQDRAELAHYLIHSLDEEADSAVEAAWDDELVRRLDDIKSGKAIGIPSDQVFDELRRKYS